MKIGFVLYPNAVISGKSNGIRSQASQWKKGLEELGHEIEEINLWTNYSWKKFDLIHIFGSGMWLYKFVELLHQNNKRIVLSPIIDSTQSYFRYKISTYFGCSKFRLWSPTYTLKKSLKYIDKVFVRSEYESDYLTISMNVQDHKIVKIPLFYNFEVDYNGNLREDFCLHISSIHQERKNVIRLIKAAKKYGFKLVLAGSKGTEGQYESINNEIGNSSNIEVLGFISDSQKVELCSKAKVFALPSISEGVGIVALDAAASGCEIVITKIGGPKEYYNNMAGIVDPYNVDDIGIAILNLIEEKISFQPILKDHISQNYSKNIIIKKIEKVYFEVTAKKQL